MTRNSTRDPIQVIVVGAPLAVSAITFSILDVLASAGRSWEELHGSRSGSPIFQVSLRTLDGRQYMDVNGRTVTPDGRLDDGPTPDLVVIPAMDIDPRNPLPKLLVPVASWIARSHSNGAIVASVGRQHEDLLVSDAQVWAAVNYTHSTPVAAMAKRSGLTERSFLRRFKRATGLAPVEYIQRLRVEEAKQLLETTRMPIDEIAAEVGYTESSSFRSAFRKNVGQTATAYRCLHQMTRR